MFLFDFINILSADRYATDSFLFTIMITYNQKGCIYNFHPILFYFVPLCKVRGGRTAMTSVTRAVYIDFSELMVGSFTLQKVNAFILNSYLF